MPKFEKGRSGNPGGRPKAIRAIEEIAREHSDLAIRRLVEIVEDPDSPPGVAAMSANMLLDRAWGRPSQRVEASVEVKHDLAQALTAARDRVRGRLT